MEGLKNVHELRLAEAVEVCHHGVKFADVILAFIWGDGTALNADAVSPLGKAVVGCRKPA